MYSIEILGCGTYLPKQKIDNSALNKEYNLEENWIYRRSGIKTRYYVKDESISDLAIKATENLIQNYKIDISKVEAIIVATTSSQSLMPGISYDVQKAFSVRKCICMDILGGCSGYINAFDIARNYIAIGKIENALVIGVDVLSKFIDFSDINTAVLLGDGAGATLIGRSKEEKLYASEIESDGSQGDILTIDYNKKLYMNGKKVYKFAITKTVENIDKLLKDNGQKIEDIKYIVPHQSNLRILNNISQKLEIEKNKINVSLQEIGNTFCASIPITLQQMYEEKLLKKGDKIILLGYGGGLNWGSILLEI